MRWYKRDIQSNILYTLNWQTVYYNKLPMVMNYFNVQIINMRKETTDRTHLKAHGFQLPSTTHTIIIK